MAISWLSALKAVPWKDVVTSAPSIVEGTKRLWANVAKTERRAETPRTPDAAEVDGNGLAALDRRVSDLESKAAALAHDRAHAATLLQSLAEQNAHLVQAVELLRRRTRRLAWSVIGLAVLIAVLLAWVTLHR